uniref:Uncharacterized protein n=1 Tax=Peronospora matthiolae TaxID=2874970 RepID=A0AAV1UUM2_9STRA
MRVINTIVSVVGVFQEMHSEALAAAALGHHQVSSKNSVMKADEADVTGMHLNENRFLRGEVNPGEEKLVGETVVKRIVQLLPDAVAKMKTLGDDTRKIREATKRIDEGDAQLESLKKIGVTLRQLLQAIKKSVHGMQLTKRVYAEADRVAKANHMELVKKIKPSNKFRSDHQKSE